MRKRILIPAVVAGALTGVFFIGQSGINKDIDACNEGKDAACVELAKYGGNFFGNEKVTNPAYKTALKQVEAKKAAEAKEAVAEKPAQAEKLSDYDNCLKLRAEVNAVQAGLGDKSYDCERVKNWKTPVERVAAAGGRDRLIRSCEASFKSSLKDPNSYRYLGAQVVAKNDKELTVSVNYTATNSMGGRVQGTETCTFQG